MGLIRGIFVLLALSLLSSCALFSPSYEKPQINLVKIEPLSRKGLEQRIVVGLHIINPSDSDLNISGLSYHLKLQDIKVVSGATSGLKPIPAFSESRLELQASINLFSGFRVIERVLMNDGTVDFELETKISTSWWRWPVKVVESGSIDLSAFEDL